MKNKIKIVELPVPEPKENQVQISVKASSLSVSDFKPFIDRMETGKLSMASKSVAGKQPFGGDVYCIPHIVLTVYKFFPDT